MTTYFDDDAALDGPGDERAATSLDRALDDFVRGHPRRAQRLDTDTASTVDRLFALAEVSGMPGATRVRPLRQRRWWTALASLRRVASFGTAAALIVLLAITLNQVAPGFRDQGAALGTAVPTSEATSEEVVTVPPLTAADCGQNSRDREELLSILSIAPAVDNVLANRETPPESVDAATFDAITKSIRGWLAYDRYGSLEQRAWWESEQYIRRLIYGNDVLNQAYSTTTLNELIDGHEQILSDLQQPVEWQIGWKSPLAFDNVTLSETRTIAYVTLHSIVYDSEQNAEPVHIVLVLEDEVWRVWWLEDAPVR